MAKPISEGVKDPGLYRKMSEPFENLDAANSAIAEFNTELRELRAKHHIADVTAIIGGSYVTEDGDESYYLIDLQHGDLLKRESMLAFAFGRAQREREETIGKYLSGNATKRK